MPLLSKEKEDNKVSERLTADQIETLQLSGEPGLLIKAAESPIAGDHCPKPSVEILVHHINDDLNSNSSSSEGNSGESENLTSVPSILHKTGPSPASPDRNRKISSESKDSGVGEEADATCSDMAAGLGLTQTSNPVDKTHIVSQADDPSGSGVSGCNSKPKNTKDIVAIDVQGINSLEYCTCEGSEASEDITISKLDADQTSISQGRLGFIKNKEQEDAENMPDSHLYFAGLMSIATPMMGIPAVIMALKCRKNIAEGHVEEAWKYSTRALVLSLFGVWLIGFLIVICYIMVLCGYDTITGTITTPTPQFATSAVWKNVKLTHEERYMRHHLRNGEIYDVNYDLFNRYLK